MTTLYAVRLSDGSFMGPRKPDGEVRSFLCFTDPAEAGNCVIWRKQHGKIPADEVAFLHSFHVSGGEVKVSGFGEILITDTRSMHDLTDEEKTQA